MRYFRKHFVTELSKGFTLIELMVSIALFSVVVAIVAAAFTSLLSQNRIALATNNISNNLSFVVDSMERSIRTGSGYSANASYSGGGAASFSFTDDQGNPVTYSSSGGSITECYGSGCTASPMTDPNITISYLRFYVQGVDTGNGDNTQPQVTFVIKGQMTTDPVHAPVSFDIEGAATMRQINI